MPIVVTLPIMSIVKKTKDHFIKLIFGKAVVPRGLSELNNYFRIHGPINFKFQKGEDSIVAVSTDFVYGSIITSAKNCEEIDEKIKDAIMTSFEVPSSYAKEADIKKVCDKKEEYAFA